MARWIAGIVGLCLAGMAAPAEADVIRFMHPHPMPPGVVKGMCHIDGPHFHAFKPHKPLLYVKVEGHHAFIGDPVEYEPKGTKYAYYGHHPAFWVEDDPYGEVHHYCYITGPHHHYYAPPARLKFKVKGGVHWWVGAHPKWYRKRYRRYRPVDRYYARVHLARPVVTVAPPVGFVGVIVGPRGRARVHGHVGAGVHVSAPPPGIDVQIRVPGVGVVLGGGPRPRRGVVVYEGRPRRGKHHKYKYKKRGHGPRFHGHGWGFRKGKKAKKRKRRRK